MLIPEETKGPKTITGFICIQKRKFLESQHLPSYKQANREFEFDYYDPWVVKFACR